MSKRILSHKSRIFMLLAVMSAMLIACGKKEESVDKIRDLDFTVLGADEQPEELKEIIAEKQKEPFQISYTLGSDLYIAIGYGEQKSGGYSITVDEFYEGETTLSIDTTLIGPKNAESVTNTVTYPYIVIKTENIDDKLIEFH